MSSLLFTLARWKERSLQVFDCFSVILLNLHDDVDRIDDGGDDSVDDCNGDNGYDILLGHRSP